MPIKDEESPFHLRNLPTKSVWHEKPLIVNLLSMAKEVDIAKTDESKYNKVLKPLSFRSPVKHAVPVGFDSEFHPETGELLSIQFAIIKEGKLLSKLYYCSDLDAKSLLEYVLRFLKEIEIDIPKKPRIYLIAHFAQAEISKIRGYLRDFKLRVYNKAMSAEVSLGALEEQGFDFELHQKGAFKSGKFRLKIIDLYGYFPRALESVGMLVGLPKLEIDRTKIHIIKDTDPERFEAYAKRDAEICALAFRELRELFLSEFEIDILYYPTTAGLASAIFRQNFLKDFAVPYRYVPKVYKRRRASGEWYEKVVYEPIFAGSRDVRYMAMQSYWGGRTESYGRGYLEGDFEYYDIVSIYPSVSMLQPLPSKETEWIRFKTLNVALPLEGFCRVTFKFPETCKYPCLPCMPSYAKKLYFPLKGESWCTLSEVRTSLKLGAQIQEIDGYGFKPSGAEIDHDLANFMRHFLRLKQSEPKGTIKHEMWKLNMNSLIGKFCQRSPTYNINDMVAFIQKSGLEDLSDPKLRRHFRRLSSVGPMWMPEWATLILGRARAVMGELISKGSLFCSTDSGLFPKGTNLNCEALHALRSVESDFIKEYECDSIFLARSRLYALFKDGKMIKCGRHGTIATPQDFELIVKENLRVGRDLERPAKRTHLVRLKESLNKGEPLGKQVLQKRPIGWKWDGKRELDKPNINIWKGFSYTSPLNEVPQPETVRPSRKHKPGGQYKIGRPKALTQKQIEELKKLRKAGWSIRRLAKHYEVGVATVQRYLK